MKAKALFWGIVNSVLLAGVLIVNTLSAALPLNGRTPGEIADSFQVLFAPAAYVFSIWGLIYLALLAFVVYQFLPSHWESPRVRVTDGLFAASCIANAGWLFAWHYGTYVLSMAAMLVLLFSLTAIYLSQRTRDVRREQPTWGERIFVLAPFSLYLGWISVATIANAAAVLSWAGFSGWGISAVAWTVIVSLLAAALSVFMSFVHRDEIFPAVVVWALTGEIVRKSDLSEVVIGCIAAIAVTAVAAVWGVALRKPAALNR